MTSESNLDCTSIEVQLIVNRGSIAEAKQARFKPRKCPDGLLIVRSLRSLGVLGFEFWEKHCQDGETTEMPCGLLLVDGCWLAATPQDCQDFRVHGALGMTRKCRTKPILGKENDVAIILSANRKQLTTNL